MFGDGCFHLADAGEKCLTIARQLYSMGYSSCIAWSTCNYGAARNSVVELAKRVVIDTRGVFCGRLTRVVASNSIEEARLLLNALPDANHFVLVVDRIHAPRVEKIWRHVANEMGRSVKLTILTVKARWDDPNNVSSHQRSEARFLFLNVVAHILLSFKAGWKFLEGRTHQS